MKKINRLFASCTLLLLCCSGCDEGKIYPDEHIDNGRTATATLRFSHLEAWPKKNSLSLVSLGEDNGKPLLVKRILEPSSEEETVTVTLNNLSEDTRHIAVAVVTPGMALVHTYKTFAVDASERAFILPETEVDVASFSRIRSQVFNAKCIMCHGGSDRLAGQLDLTPSKAYASLINVTAPHSASGKNYVTPGDPENCHLLDVFEQDNHKDIFNGMEQREVLALLRTWIKEGAANN